MPEICQHSGTSSELPPVMVSREQSPREELANSMSHGVALVAAFIAIPFLIVHAAEQGNDAFLAGACIFSGAIVLVYLFSTIYHALPMGKAKNFFRVADYCAIFLLIAGTYTPFTLGVLRGPLGWALFGLVWGFALLGVFLNLFVRNLPSSFSTGFYVLMGWIAIIAASPVYEKVPKPGLLWLIAGGLSYSIGVPFFVISSRHQYSHLIWHLLVVAGTACHFVAVFWYAA